MKRVITIVVFGFIFSAKAQTSVSNDTLHWSENKQLTWDDFKGEPIEGVGFVGETFCMILATFEKANVFSKTKFSVTNVYDRTKAWISKEYKSGIQLSYFQVMFNIYEVHARSLRKDLATNSFDDDPTAQFQEKYNTSMTNMTNEVNQFKRETKMGTNVNVLNNWKTIVDNELNELSEYKH